MATAVAESAAPVTAKAGPAATHPDLPGITATWEFISVADAKAILADRNIGNRTIRERRHLAMERDLANDYWCAGHRVNGDTIRYDEDGNLIDGQHRLKLISRMNGDPETTGLLLLVVRGLPHEVQKTIDRNAVRRVYDDLHMNGTPNANLVAAIARQVFQFLETRDRGGAGSGSTSATDYEVRETIEKYPDIIDAARWTNTNRAKYASMGSPAAKALTGAAVGFCYWMYCRYDKTTGEQFMTQVLSGADVAEGSGVMALRRRLERARELREKMPTYQQIAFTNLAWNAFHAGDTRTKLQAPQGGWKSGNAPEPAYVRKSITGDDVLGGG